MSLYCQYELDSVCILNKIFYIFLKAPKKFFMIYTLVVCFGCSIMDKFLYYLLKNLVNVTIDSDNDHIHVSGIE